MLFSNRVRIRIRFSVWLMSGHAHIFILIIVVIVTAQMHSVRVRSKFIGSNHFSVNIFRSLSLLTVGEQT